MLKRTRSIHCRGFTLTELAIVLTAISFLIGGIWAIGDKAWSNFGSYKANKQITQVAQNIREQYLGVQTPPSWVAIGLGKDINLVIDGLNLFPIEMRRFASKAPGDNTQFIDHGSYDGLDTTSLNNGSVHVFYVNAAGAQSANGTNVPSTAACGQSACFRIWLYGLDPPSCIKLLQALPISDQQIGIVNMGVVVADGNTGGLCYFGSCTTTAKITASLASTWCYGASESNTLFWDFKLHN